MPRKGILFILIATLAFAVMNALAKELSDFHPMQVVFFRAFGSFIFIYPVMVTRKIPILGTHRKFLFLRGLVGFISLAAFFLVVQRIPLGSAISIRYLGPIFGSLLAYFFLKERVYKMQWISFAIAFSGVIVLKGFDIRIDTMSLVLLLVSAFLVGIVFVLIKHLSSREHFLTIINYFMVISLLGSIGFISYWRVPQPEEWYAVLGIGVSGLIGQIYMTRAFATEDTSVLAPFKYMELVYALILGYFIFGETYDYIPLLGIILIIIGMMANVYAKQSGNRAYS